MQRYPPDMKKLPGLFLEPEGDRFPEDLMDPQRFLLDTELVQIPGVPVLASCGKNIFPDYISYPRTDL